MKKTPLLLAIFFLLSLSAYSQSQPPACKIIREVRYPVTKTEPSRQPLRIALLDLCPKDRGMVARPMMPMMVAGQMQMFEYDVLQVFKDQAEADLYAKENGIIEPKQQFPPDNGCRVVRRVAIPLTKRPGQKLKQAAALVNVCLSDPGMRQRPVTGVLVSGKKEWREFEVEKVFKSEKEARRFAKENNITDFDLSK